MVTKYRSSLSGWWIAIPERKVWHWNTWIVHQNIIKDIWKRTSKASSQTRWKPQKTNIYVPFQKSVTSWFSGLKTKSFRSILAWIGLHEGMKSRILVLSCKSLRQRIQTENDGSEREGKSNRQDAHRVEAYWKKLSTETFLWNEPKSEAGKETLNLTSGLTEEKKRVQHAR